MFNSPFTGGTDSWDSGADVYSGPGGEVHFDPAVYGNEMTPASFTEEIFFKTDYANDPTLGTVKQTLIWNHRTSAFANLQLNESANGNTNDIGSLLFGAIMWLAFPPSGSRPRKTAGTASMTVIGIMWPVASTGLPW